MSAVTLPRMGAMTVAAQNKHKLDLIWYLVSFPTQPIQPITTTWKWEESLIVLESTVHISLSEIIAL
jgi:hypothetical protein